MKFFNKRSPTGQKRSDDTGASQVVMTLPTAFQELLSTGYTKLSDSPEVRMAVDTIADMVSNMTIQLMQNGETGDKRVKNALSRVVDIEPNKYLSRKSFIQWIVRSMLLEGNGNAIVKPTVVRGEVIGLTPISPYKVTFNVSDDDLDYAVSFDNHDYDPSELLHFVINPSIKHPFIGTGYKVALKDIVGNLKQANITKKGFMSSEYMPSLIVSVDSDSDKLGDEEGRTKFEEMYLKRKDTGKPWIIPEGMINIQQIKPLTLNDLALNDAVTLDKKTVAGLFGVPAFLLGVGTYNKDEFNNFVNTKVLSIAQVIQQTLNKLIIDDDMYFTFNPRSLYNYSLLDMVNAGTQMVKVNALRRNELRNWVGMPPDEEMSDLIVLENYLLQEDLNKQGKLVQENTQKGGEE
ncbi:MULTISPECIES: phage portal protein [unclassified Lactococcus]|uniref:phage portal protein n=1 Tax=unclassified Lactococcus TaxID=2643510 RepID=UPI0011CB5BEC|nr:MULTISPECIES: phage portal protein [unclassified Lactococcus]MQW22951.1 phage portal protein [Lactococcus sp. dk101]TXK44502.1 phage portal protein [Lactococcus sp. dk310]TXK50355.1 phage portal protein [Lactococcus sp. dk322]